MQYAISASLPRYSTRSLPAIDLHLIHFSALRRHRSKLRNNSFGFHGAGDDAFGPECARQASLSHKFKPKWKTIPQVARCNIYSLTVVDVLIRIETLSICRMRESSVTPTLLSKSF